MRFFVTIAAMLALAPSGMHAQAESRRFSCEGAGRENGFPHGPRETGTRKFRFLDDGERSAVFELGPTISNLCATGAECAVSSAADTVQLDVSRIPGRDPLVTAN